MRILLLIATFALLGGCKLPSDSWPSEAELPLIELEVESCYILGTNILCINFNDDYMNNPQYTNDGDWSLTGTTYSDFERTNHLSIYEMVWINSVPLRDSFSLTGGSHNLPNCDYSFSEVFNPIIHQSITFDTDTIFYLVGEDKALGGNVQFTIAKLRIKTEYIEIRY